ncbi:hypothetical protein AXZ77_1760 [Thioclava sp. ES.031]|uniref:hypothetical protein n=1 Tax=Thioclava sp. ES.031 TaxID=1798203 RepID=UPI000BF4BE55|nr:hypothetical protein [Thioclava sp. ES.031]PFG63162.1 hypothetical protein AXZ77_1760 [Thioclava sp. ES.031]
MRRRDPIGRAFCCALGGLVALTVLAPQAQAQPPVAWQGWSLARQPRGPFLPGLGTPIRGEDGRGLDFGLLGPVRPLGLLPQAGWIPDFSARPQLGLNFGRGSGFAQAQAVSGLPKSGPLVMTGPHAGRGDISVDLSPALGAGGALSGAHAVASLTIPDGQGGTLHIAQQSFSPATPGNHIETYAFSPASGGGGLAELSLDGATGTASALAAVFDPGGFSVIGLGAPDSARVEQRVSTHSRVRELGGVIASPLGRSRDWSWGPRLGLGDLSRHTSETYTTTASLTASRALPAIETTRRTRLHARSESLTLGLGGRRLLSKDLAFGLYLDLGAKAVSARGRSEEMLSIPGLASASSAPERSRFSALEPILRAGMVFEQRLGGNSFFALSLGVQETGQTVLVSRLSGQAALGSASVSGATLSSTGETVRHDEIRWRHGFEGTISINFVHLF